VWCVYLNLVIAQKFQLITIDIVIELFFQVDVKEKLRTIVNTIKFYLLPFNSLRIRITFRNFICRTIAFLLIIFLEFGKIFWLFYEIIYLCFNLKPKLFLSSSEFFSSVPTSIHIEMSSIRIVFHKFEKCFFLYA
jgi:hypothetical protein